MNLINYSFFSCSKTAEVDTWILIKNAERNSFGGEFQVKEVLLIYDRLED